MQDSIKLQGEGEEARADGFAEESPDRVRFLLSLVLMTMIYSAGFVKCTLSFFRYI